MTALQTFSTTSTSTPTTEIDTSHYGRPSTEYKQQRPFQAMEQRRISQDAASATEAVMAEIKDYNTVGSTLHHLERTGQVSAPGERPDALEQGRSVEENTQTTVLDRRKEGDVQRSSNVANDADDAAVSLSTLTDGPEDARPRKRRRTNPSERETLSQHSINTAIQATAVSQPPEPMLHPPQSLPSIPPPSDPTPPAPPDYPLQTPPPSHLTSNLLSLFSLQPLVSSVARTDPHTGEKINKMRKSYEGHVKSFSLAGRNRAVRYDPTTFSPLYKDRLPMRLIDLAKWPEEEWSNQKVHGKDVKRGLGEEVKSRLGETMEFAPGKVPENEKWEDLLGLEKSRPSGSTANKGSAGLANGQALPNGAQQRSSMKQGNSNNNTNSNRSEAARPRRANKKRRYDDGSFEGYGEGFVDDELEDFGAEGGGYSSAGSSRRGSLHKKRKVV